MTEIDIREPPVDPRDRWDLPAPGTMPVVTELDEVVTRVLAPNPSPMTLDGTNTYVVGVPGRGEVILIDPGPEDAGHLERVRGVVRGREAAVRTLVVTHHHADHAAAAASWASVFDCDVSAASPAVAGPHGRVVGDGDVVPLLGLEVVVVATPGHTRDHVSIRLGTGALVTGDHVLGRGTSVVAHPDGDLASYLESLRRVMAMGPDTLLPGHGPELNEDPTAVLRFYRDHRRFREAQLLGALADGPAAPPDLVARIYAGVDRRVWPAAEASTRAALVALCEAGRLRETTSGRFALVPR